MPRQKLERNRLLRLLLLTFFGVILVFGIGQLRGGIGLEPVIAQSPSLRPESISELAYERFSYLSLENQYIRQDTEEVDRDNTLITRLIRYHQDVKKRPTRFRLDWKLTLADYLGVNEPMKPERYPGNSTLTINPMEKDIQSIRQLNRRQRTELVDFLASLYQPKQEKPSSSNSPSFPTSKPSSPMVPTSPSLSQPGDAQLLMP